MFRKYLDPAPALVSWRDDPKLATFKADAAKIAKSIEETTAALAAGAARRRDADRHLEEVSLRVLMREAGPSDEATARERVARADEDIAECNAALERLRQMMARTDAASAILSRAARKEHAGRLRAEYLESLRPAAKALLEARKRLIAVGQLRDLIEREFSDPATGVIRDFDAQLANGSNLLGLGYAWRAALGHPAEDLSSPHAESMLSFWLRDLKAAGIEVDKA